MIFDELLKGQLLTNDCNNYLIATNTGEIIESCYRCLHRREKKALELYKKDISIINTKIIDNNFERTLCIIVANIAGSIFSFVYHHLFEKIIQLLINENLMFDNNL